MNFKSGRKMRVEKSLNYSISDSDRDGFTDRMTLGMTNNVMHSFYFINPWHSDLRIRENIL